MFNCVLFSITLLLTSTKNVFSVDYESDDKLYMLVSPDHHQRTPRLEDFFWTGSGDGPPPPPDLSIFPPPPPTSELVRTTTVLATVYLDSYPGQAVTDVTTGECVKNCGEPVAPDSLEPEIPEDRRYWLVTVIQGSTPDSLQLKLARLYQKAFLRQQERHLGIIKSLDAPTGRKKHDVHSFLIQNDNNNTNLILKEFSSNQFRPIQSSMVALEFETNSFETPYNRDMRTDVYTFTNKPNNTSAELLETYPVEDIDTPNYNIEVTKVNKDSWILAAPSVVIKKRDVSHQNKNNETKDLIDMPLEIDGNATQFKREIIRPDQQPPVKVHIQNITESPDTGSVQIVYVVLVGGRAVPAAVAARDMKLVRDAEVAKELGAVVTTKAEPAYLKAAEGLKGDAETTGIHGTELWALAIGAAVTILLLLLLLALLCFTHRKKQIKSAAAIRTYRNELIRETERNQLKQVHEEKDGKLISVVSPSRTRPSSTILPIYRAASASSSSTTSSGVPEIAAAFRRRQKKPHALRMPKKKRVGTTDSLLEAAGLDSSDSGQPSVPHTPTSYLSMPSVNSFPRGNVVEPLSRILEPVSVRHLDIDSPVSTPKINKQKQEKSNIVPRRQMPSQLVRLGSIDKDPGVIGPLVWDLHCQRIKDGVSKPTSPEKPARTEPGPSRMRQRFNELMDDAFTLFGSAGSSPNSHDTYTIDTEKNGVHKEKLKRDSTQVTQARNDNVRLPGSPYSAMDTVRGKSAGPRRGSNIGPTSERSRQPRPSTSFIRPVSERKGPTPALAWGPNSNQSLGGVPSVPTVNPLIVMADGRLQAEDPAVPLISAIKSEIQRIKENATKPNTR